MRAAALPAPLTVGGPAAQVRFPWAIPMFGETSGKSRVVVKKHQHLT